jgi:predicted HNH restriction endonuclease
MPSHMRALPKPTPGTARAMQRARARLAKTRLAAACVLVRERDGGQCVVCGMPDVEVHHIKFRSQGGKHDPENLVCLCADCHGAVHARRLWLTGPASELIVSINKPGAAA